MLHDDHRTSAPSSFFAAPITASTCGEPVTQMNTVSQAAANSAGGVMGKMISLQSIAVAVAATGLASREESRLFRFTLRHSIILATLIGLIVALYAYTGWVG